MITNYDNNNNNVMMFTRGLEFIWIALSDNIQHKERELSASFTKAYDSYLSEYHSILVRPLVRCTLPLIPKREEFYSKFGEDKELVHNSLENWLEGLKYTNNHILNNIIQEKLVKNNIIINNEKN
eukprot:TRINITY_DN3071_c0_g2_i9.p2 TRINITY_DN3071_c0_g2~~TRINITY_DN3071_c0_g2_i9.p2  ORF type:complete len:125 (-),score=15.06 TRINITY_DN3071_c0_g2_i9:180-554(-)